MTPPHLNPGRALWIPQPPLTTYLATQWFMCVSCFPYYTASPSRLGAAASYSLPLCTHGTWHIVGTQYVFKKWLNWVLNSANIVPPIFLIPLQPFFPPAAHYSCGWNELKKNVISLVNIITAVYYHGTKVITPSFSVAYTHPWNYHLRSRNSSCLLSVSEWNAAKLGEYVLGPFEWQGREWWNSPSQEKEAGLLLASR